MNLKKKENMKIEKMNRKIHKNSHKDSRNDSKHNLVPPSIDWNSTENKQENIAKMKIDKNIVHWLVDYKDFQKMRM